MFDFLLVAKKDKMKRGVWLETTFLSQTHTEYMIRNKKMPTLAQFEVEKAYLVILNKA